MMPTLKLAIIWNAHKRDCCMAKHVNWDVLEGKKLTSFESLLGAVWGQSGSYGSRQGFSWYPEVMPAWKGKKEIRIKVSRYQGVRGLREVWSSFAADKSEKVVTISLAMVSLSKSQLLCFFRVLRSSKWIFRSSPSYLTSFFFENSPVIFWRKRQ